MRVEVLLAAARLRDWRVKELYELAMVEFCWERVGSLGSSSRIVLIRALERMLLEVILLRKQSKSEGGL